MNEKLFDKRVVSRNINQGLVSQKEYDDYLTKLADLGDECTSVDVSLYPSDEEDEESKPESEEEPSPE